VVRVGGGVDHEIRSKNEFRNLNAIAQINLPFQTPRCIGTIHSTALWSAQVSSFVDGTHRDDAGWAASREALHGVLCAFQESPRPAPGVYLPVRQWCGGANWKALVDRITLALDERTRTAAHRVVRDVLECEADVQSTLVHGDFGLHNVLWRQNRISGVIDFDHATVGDPAMDVAPLIGQFGASKVAEVYDPETVARAKFHRASLPLQVAAAAELVNDTKLRNHALGNFHKRLRDGNLYDPDAV
jgi:aminoglycoside phosphotransferase (APT) family kinase protein